MHVLWPGSEILACTWTRVLLWFGECNECFLVESSELSVFVLVARGINHGSSQLFQSQSIGWILMRFVASWCQFPALPNFAALPNRCMSDNPVRVQAAVQRPYLAARLS